MKKWILKFYENDVIRYIFWGGCTTLVNLLSFYIMRAMGIPLMSANIISIILAILFAYVVNSRFVFHDRCETCRGFAILSHLFLAPSIAFSSRGRTFFTASSKVIICYLQSVIFSGVVVRLS